MTYVMSIEARPGHSYEHGWHLGTIEWIARRILEENMQTCRENDWPMVTLGLKQDGKLVDTLYRDGKWHSQLREE